LIEHYGLKGSQIKSSDLLSSDKFFSTIQNNTWKFPRSEAAWELCLGQVNPMDVDIDEAMAMHMDRTIKRKRTLSASEVPEVPEAPEAPNPKRIRSTTPSSSTSLPSTTSSPYRKPTVISTNFDISTEENKYKKAGLPEDERRRFTEECRCKAEN
ncbi:hypothetical protein V5O48_019502, partial [Marasmius crinis-equi]